MDSQILSFSLLEHFQQEEIFLFMIVGIVLVFFLVDTVVSILNLNYTKPFPKNVANIYDAEKYAAQKKYEKVKTWFGIHKNTFDTLVLLSVLFV